MALSVQPKRHRSGCPTGGSVAQKILRSEAPVSGGGGRRSEGSTTAWVRHSSRSQWKREAMLARRQNVSLAAHARGGPGELARPVCRDRWSPSGGCRRPRAGTGRSWAPWQGSGAWGRRTAKRWVFRGAKLAANGRELFSGWYIGETRRNWAAVICDRVDRKAVATRRLLDLRQDCG